MTITSTDINETANSFEVDELTCTSAVAYFVNLDRGKVTNAKSKIWHLAMQAAFDNLEPNILFTCSLISQFLIARHSLGIILAGRCM